MNDSLQNRQRQYDLCQRYGLLARILTAAFPAGPARLLDVGAGPDDLSRAYLPERFAITLADAGTFDRADITQLQPGAPLPFPDRAFDAVIAMDVLEHVQPAGRSDFVRELARVAKAAVVLSHPTATDAVVAAERVLAAAHVAWFRAPCRFLDEHAEYGLPSDSIATTALTAGGLQTAILANCPLAVWLPLTVLDVALLAQFGTGGPKDAFNATANTLEGDLRTPGEHYRTFTVGTRDEGMLARVNAAVHDSQQARTTEHDRAIAELLAQTTVQLAHNPLADGLRAAVASMNDHIQKLEALRHQQANDAQTVIAEKDDHIRKLELLMQEQVKQLLAETVAIVHTKDEHIRKLEVLLQSRSGARH